MALINRLIAEAKAGPSPVVTVREHEVRKVAEHMRKLRHDGLPVDDYVRLLCAGEVRMLGNPVVVLPEPKLYTPEPQTAEDRIATQRQTKPVSDKCGITRRRRVTR